MPLTIFSCILKLCLKVIIQNYIVMSFLLLSLLHFTSTDSFTSYTTHCIYSRSTFFTHHNFLFCTWGRYQQVKRQRNKTGAIQFTLTWRNFEGTACGRRLVKGQLPKVCLAITSPPGHSVTWLNRRGREVKTRCLKGPDPGRKNPQGKHPAPRWFFGGKWQQSSLSLFFAINFEFS